MDKNLLIKKVEKRAEVLGESLQNAFEALMEMQAEYKLIIYLLSMYSKDS